jgi:hypothetical protein
MNINGLFWSLKNLRWCCCLMSRWLEPELAFTKENAFVKSI